MKIIVNTINHKRQKYPTSGNWFYKGKTLCIEVSKLSDERYEQLIVVHELLEAILCKQAKIKESLVTKFDIKYEKNRKPGDKSEPGDDKKAPYYQEHQFSTSVERLLANWLKVNWEKYEQEVNSL